MNKIIKLLFSVIVCEGVGFLGTIFTLPSITTWYPTLHKAPFNPPSWIFGPVWTTLYFLMAVALFLVLQKKLKKQRNFLNRFIFRATILKFLLVNNFFWDAFAASGFSGNCLSLDFNCLTDC